MAETYPLLADVRAFVLSHFSQVWLSATLWTVAFQAFLSMGFSRQGYWVGCHFLLQGIFLTQESNPCLLYLLYCQVGSLPLAPHGKPNGRMLNVCVCVCVRVCVCVYIYLKSKDKMLACSIYREWQLEPLEICIDIDIYISYIFLYYSSVHGHRLLLYLDYCK